MPGALPLLSPTHLGWDFKRKEVEAPGSQGLQREEKKVSSKWWLPRPSSPCLPLVSSACVQPLPAGALYPGVVSLSHVPPPPQFPGYLCSPVCLSPRLCLLSSPPLLSTLPSSLSAFSSPAAFDTCPCPQAQCPHQHSVFKLLGFRLQLHAMLLEHSPLAQAPPDAVYRWVRACLEFPLSWLPPPLQDSPGAGADGRREKQRQRTGTQTCPLPSREERGVEKTLALDVPE